MAYRQTAAVKARLQGNRGRILATARNLVSEGGWQETQIASVAAAAGIATGTVYRYFPSKAELFAEVLGTVSQREAEVLAGIAVSDGSALERLAACVATFVKRAMRNPRLAYALIAEPCEPEIDSARLTWRADISEVIRRLIEAGQANGEIRADVQPEIAATVIVGGFMEGLIGPLSPLSHHQGADAAGYPSRVAALADQIAAIACAGVAATALPSPPRAGGKANPPSGRRRP